MPARKLSRPLVERNTELAKALLCIAAIEAAPQAQREREVVANREALVQRRGLRDIPDERHRPRRITPRIDPANGNVTRARRLQTDPGLEERGLAGTVRADERDKPGFVDDEVETTQGGLPSIALHKAVRGECRKGAFGKRGIDELAHATTVSGSA